MWKGTPPHALLKCNAISQGCAGGSRVNSRSHPERFSTQLLKANSSKLRFPLLPPVPCTPKSFFLFLHRLPSAGADGPKPGSPYLPETCLQRRNGDFKILEVAAGLKPTPMFVAYHTGTGSNSLCVSPRDTLGLRSAAKARHLQMLCVGVHRLSATVAGSQVNQSFEVALPRPSLYHQLSKDHHQGFETPKLVI